MDAALIDLRERGVGYNAAGERLGVAPTVIERRIVHLGLPAWGREGGRRGKRNAKLCEGKEP
jgi:hypothetical protein